MIIKDNMANMCAKVTSTYMEFTLAFGPKPEFSFSFKLFEKMKREARKHLILSNICTNIKKNKCSGRQLACEISEHQQ